MNRFKYSIWVLVLLVSVFIDDFAIILVGFAYGVWATLSMINTYIRSKRGTNAVTRFIRNGSMSLQLQGYTGIGITMTTLCVVICFIYALAFGGEWIAMLGAVPPLLTVVLSLVLLAADTASAQRKKDSRYVTKQTVAVGAAAGGAVAGATVGLVAGGPAGAAVGAAAGAELGFSGGIVATAEMDRTDYENGDPHTVAAYERQQQVLEERQKRQAIQQTQSEALPVNNYDEELFMQKAAKLGIQTEGRSVHDVAVDVVNFAPASSKAELDPNMSVEEQAMSILHAYS